MGGDTGSDVFTPNLAQEQSEGKSEATRVEIPVTDSKTVPGGKAEGNTSTGNTSGTQKQENTDARPTVDTNGAISSQLHVVKDSSNDNTQITDSPSIASVIM